ncbi:MAG: recombinase family protein, partial [Calditrichaeota bacterium]|nr:recombinase family protein [Calditrichota bacterium]
MNNIGSANFKPVVGYLRRSTDRQEQSIDDQRQVIEGYAVNNGYNVIDYYIDDAISGASSEGRASFLRLIHDAKQGDCPFKFVLVYDIKR